MSGRVFERLTRTLPDGHPITILKPSCRRGGGAGRQHVGVGPRGRPLVHPAVDEIAVQTHSPEVSMHDR